MWEWIAGHPNATKEDWIYYQGQDATEIADYNDCHACLEAQKHCCDCPVTWHDSDMEYQGCPCEESGPYLDWLITRSQVDAKRVLDCIINTWTESDQ